MQPALIKLVYRQVIDASSGTAFENTVFNDSYEEFLLQSQAYNQQNSFTSFEQMVANNPKANSLHYKVGFSIGLYVKGLNGRVNGLQDSFNKYIPFISHQFEIIASDISNKTLHKVALLYQTDTLTLIDYIGNNLLLATGDVVNSISAEGADTFLVPLQPGLSIVNYRKLAEVPA